MKPDVTLDILKQAILLEYRGKAFYTNAAESSKDPDVRNIFQIMAAEEDDHIRFLTEQLRHYREGGKFDFVEATSYENETITDEVITKSIVEKLSAVSFEAAAISLAIDMENRAITAYSERSAAATDPDEKKFYQWLAEWEQGHHLLLYQLDTELREKIWTDNNFWAF